MCDYKKILAALDFSGPSHAAAREALALAAAMGAEVTLCHVIDSRYMGLSGVHIVEPFALQEERLRKVAQRRMDQLVSEVPGAPEVRTALPVGIPCDEILAERERWGADLVVLGTHGRTGLKRAIVGSQAELVLGKCPVPVLIVHAPAKEAEPASTRKLDGAATSGRTGPSGDSRRDRGKRP
ncbi:MAG: universal stress protein UspA [Planctomycetes bacterium]|nr:universal stress protein UspA [Planctomycetota bacterium]